MVTDGLPCTISLLSPPYSEVRGRSYKGIALHLLPAISALPRLLGPWFQIDCSAPFPCYPALLWGSGPWLKIDCPAPSP